MVEQWYVLQRCRCVYFVFLKLKKMNKALELKPNRIGYLYISRKCFDYVRIFDSLPNRDSGPIPSIEQFRHRDADSLKKDKEYENVSENWYIVHNQTKRNKQTLRFTLKIHRYKQDSLIKSSKNREDTESPRVSRVCSQQANPAPIIVSYSISCLYSARILTRITFSWPTRNQLWIHPTTSPNR